MYVHPVAYMFAFFAIAGVALYCWYYKPKGPFNHWF